MFYAEQERVGEHSRRVRARKDGEIHGGTEGKCVYVFDIYIHMNIEREREREIARDTRSGSGVTC